MRIYKRDEQWEPRFSLQWEEQRLDELGNDWVSFSIPGDSYTIGRMHAQSHEITFFQNIEGQNSLLVALEFPERLHEIAPIDKQIQASEEEDTSECSCL